MSLFDKDFKPFFPARSGGSIGGAAERQMAYKLDMGDFRTVMRSNPDGSTTMLRTKGGMPSFETVPRRAAAGPITYRYSISFFGKKTFCGTYVDDAPFEAKGEVLLSAESSDGIFQLYMQKKEDGAPSGLLVADSIKSVEAESADPLVTKMILPTYGEASLTLWMFASCDTSSGGVPMWGNPYHGVVSGGWFTDSGNKGTMYVPTFDVGWSWLTKFPSITAPVTPAVDLDRGLVWADYNIWFGRNKRYSAGSDIDFGRDRWVYRSPGGKVWRLRCLIDWVSSGSLYRRRLTVYADSFGFAEQQIYQEVFAGNFSNATRVYNDEVANGIETGTDRIFTSSYAMVNHSPAGDRAVAWLVSPYYYHGAIYPFDQEMWFRRPQLFRWATPLAREVVISEGDSDYPICSGAMFSSNYGDGSELAMGQFCATYSPDTGRLRALYIREEGYGSHTLGDHHIFVSVLDETGSVFDEVEITGLLTYTKSNADPYWFAYYSAITSNNTLSIFTGATAGQVPSLDYNQRVITFDCDLNSIVTPFPANSLSEQGKSVTAAWNPFSKEIRLAIGAGDPECFV